MESVNPRWVSDPVLECDLTHSSTGGEGHGWAGLCPCFPSVPILLSYCRQEMEWLLWIFSHLPYTPGEVHVGLTWLNICSTFLSWMEVFICCLGGTRFPCREVSTWCKSIDNGLAIVLFFLGSHWHNEWALAELSDLLHFKCLIALSSQRTLVDVNM